MSGLTTLSWRARQGHASCEVRVIAGVSASHDRFASAEIGGEMSFLEAHHLFTKTLNAASKCVGDFADGEIVAVCVTRRPDA